MQMLSPACRQSNPLFVYVLADVLFQCSTDVKALIASMLIKIVYAQHTEKILTVAVNKLFIIQKFLFEVYTAFKADMLSFYKIIT